MSKELEHAELAPLVSLLTDLANEIDGVVDFGMTVCILEEEKMTGRHSYIIQRCDKIRRIVVSINSFLEKLGPREYRQLSALQSEMVANSDLMLNAFASLEHFRSRGTDVICSLTDTVRTGWESTHRTIRSIAEVLNIFDQSWYFPILERQNSYRTQLGNLCAAFHESVATATTP